MDPNHVMSTWFGRQCTLLKRFCTTKMPITANSSLVIGTNTVQKFDYDHCDEVLLHPEESDTEEEAESTTRDGEEDTNHEVVDDQDEGGEEEHAIPYYIHDVRRKLSRTRWNLYQKVGSKLEDEIEASVGYVKSVLSYGRAVRNDGSEIPEDVIEAIVTCTLDDVYKPKPYM